MTSSTGYAFDMKPSSLKITFIRTLLCAILALGGYSIAWAQDGDASLTVEINDSTNLRENSATDRTPSVNSLDLTYAPHELKIGGTSFSGYYFSRKGPDAQKVADVPDCCDDKSPKGNTKNRSIKDENDAPVLKEKFHWKPALTQSLVFLGFQHSFRMMQVKTRRELGGPFFRDWQRSVQNLRGWRDGDNVLTNYIGHPMQGSLTGRIFVNNSDRAKKQEFGKSKVYWESRAKALAWSALWSTQFELGPISEANLGNVGIHNRSWGSDMAYVDLVVTPVVGTAFLIGEDAIDKYLLKNWLEKKNSSRTKIKILRSFVTPTTSIANLLRGKVPWKRDERPL